jgi:glycerol kinase
LASPYQGKRSPPRGGKNESIADRVSGGTMPARRNRMTRHLIAIDQGTTSSRAIVFRPNLTVAGLAQEEFPQIFPRSGWVEHDPEDLWRTTVTTLRAALDKAGVGAEDIGAIGITNQRETVVIWDRASGRAVHNAIVWQDRRTADTCARLRADGLEPLIASRTGLLLDPYFSATKVAWILDQVEGARARAERGELAFGTVDSFLLWRLSGGRVHATDATNAARTLLFDIHKGEWDEELCRLFRVPMAMLPEVKDSSADFGVAISDIVGRPVPVCGIAGDQQAAVVGQACFRPGMMKATYGTGCFALLNTGATPVTSSNRLLTTIAYQLDGKRTYALEGAIFVAGAAVQWLRDGLGVIKHAAETGALAATADPAQHVYLVPAFVGLGAPYWDAEARGSLTGLTRATGPRELARAALESVGYQTADLIAAMRADWTGADDTVLRVDGGMTASDWTMQFLADVLDAPVDRPVVKETTALGAAYLAGLRAGLLPRPDEFARSWALDRRFTPEMDDTVRTAKIAGWRDAVRRTLTA